MNKIEELKAAYEAATGGEWDPDIGVPCIVNISPAEDDEREDCPVEFAVVCGRDAEANTHLITLMHNNLPALLEAAEALDRIEAMMLEGLSPNMFREDIARTLEKLK